MLDILKNVGVLGFREVIEAFVEQKEVLLGETAGAIGLETRKTRFFRPYAEQAEVDGLARVDPFLFRIKPFVAMADLIGRTVGQPYGARAVGSNLPEIKLVVKKDRGVILGPTSNAERWLLSDGPIGFAIDESGWSIFRNIDDRMRGGVDGPIVVVVKVEEVAAAGTSFEVVVIVEMILNLVRAPVEMSTREISAAGRPMLRSMA